MSDNSAAIAKLQKTFGTNIDKDVLAAILEVCGGDAKEAEKFLAAQGNEGYDARNLSSVEGGIPKDYPSQTPTQSSSSLVFPKTTTTTTENSNSTVVDSVQNDAISTRALFLEENITYQAHYDAQKNNYETYISVLLLLMNQGVEISKASRARILAAAWARQDKDLPEYLFNKEDLFALPQVLGGLSLLDAARKIRSIEKKIARLEKQGTVKAKKLGQLKSTINDLKREAQIGSVSGALAKHIRRWVNKIPTYKLEFYALNMPKQPWTELADIIHFNPSDFQCKWFLEFMFGKEAPKDSIIEACKNLNPDTLMEILKANHQIPYSYLRLQVKPIPEEAKPIIARYAPLDTVIWYHEELAHPEVDKIIDQRLDKEIPNFGYGKLMERLLYFKSNGASFFKKLMPFAEERLKQINLQLETPVVVIGDASYSMDVAIRVATVIASVLTALCGAELKFFTGECVDPPIVPRSVAEVLQVATNVKAHGQTAPAAALWPYYQAKKVVKFFIVVTDEVENDKYKGYYFPTLFQKYYKEVYPAKIVFVSFLENPSLKGRMVTALESMGITPLQFKLDGKRPDLTKLDSLLGLLASESSCFPQQVSEVVAKVKNGKGLKGAIEAVSLPRPTISTTSTSSSTMEGENNNNASTSNSKEEESTVTKKVKNLTISANAQDSKFCVICEERENNTALLECGHMNFCENCAEGLKECPICRRSVIRTIRIYQH